MVKLRLIEVYLLKIYIYILFLSMWDHFALCIMDWMEFCSHVGTFVSSHVKKNSGCWWRQNLLGWSCKLRKHTKKRLINTNKPVMEEMLRSFTNCNVTIPKFKIVLHVNVVTSSIPLCSVGLFNQWQCIIFYQLIMGFVICNRVKCTIAYFSLK